jgi:hypothetical protein
VPASPDCEWKNLNRNCHEKGLDELMLSLRHGYHKGSSDEWVVLQLTGASEVSTDGVGTSATDDETGKRRWRSNRRD